MYIFQSLRNNLNWHRSGDLIFGSNHVLHIFGKISKQTSPLLALPPLRPPTHSILGVFGDHLNSLQLIFFLGASILVMHGETEKKYD